MKENKKLLQAFIIFCAGIVLMLGFITLLKFQNPKTGLLGFILCLVGMHSGILCFITSQKIFHKAGLDPKKFYSEVYYYVLVFIPALLYKFIIVNIWESAYMGDDAYLAMILTITGFCLIVCARTAVLFGKAINRGELPAYVPKPKKQKGEKVDQ